MDKLVLTRNNDFRRIYARGKNQVHPILITYVMKNRKNAAKGVTRSGITASKKIGNAVQRNRSRRVIRAAFQSLLPRMDKNRNLDLIFVARGKTPFVKSTAVQKVMEKHLKEAGILR